MIEMTDLTDLINVTITVENPEAFRAFLMGGSPVRGKADGELLLLDTSTGKIGVDCFEIGCTLTEQSSAAEMLNAVRCFHYAYSHRN